MTRGDRSRPLSRFPSDMTGEPHMSAIGPRRTSRADPLAAPEAAEARNGALGRAPLSTPPQHVFNPVKFIGNCVKFAGVLGEQLRRI
jgi:hypothetical protein